LLANLIRIDNTGNNWQEGIVVRAVMSPKYTHVQTNPVVFGGLVVNHLRFEIILTLNLNDALVPDVLSRDYMQINNK